MGGLTYHLESSPQLPGVIPSTGNGAEGPVVVGCAKAKGGLMDIG